MANTYTQLYIHAIFAVNGRLALIPDQHLEEMFKIITGIVQKRGHKMLAVGGMPDHTHVFIGLDPTQAISDLLRDIKAGTSKNINERGWFRHRFEWQEGYGAFSHSRSQVDAVCRYILSQESHHQHRSFREEYLKLLNDFEIDYDERYLFKWIE